jgi:hypothetical protein
VPLEPHLGSPNSVYDHSPAIVSVDHVKL